MKDLKNKKRDEEKKTVNKLSKCCGCKFVGLKWDFGLGKEIIMIFINDKMNNNFLNYS